ncbi:hypothetical protein BFU36_12630 [Sulfolobus sp. A20]|uniref:Zn-ribbon domain-containing OB-fold protein n=1 Tax=Sulfolobaceae TaxID=118883 RepID=UPI000845F0A3|nr:MULTISPECIES: hypothetical protein [unclassified Sulfolobus]TRM75314.1 hypothetical protein DJ532_10455 [Sulfolobus sp. A20-N-F8]TRM76154.1 hypothetical protein DJ523_01695 [Sulfolobus sp. E5]TRM77281.1 hypothetical protein DJ528_06995 [Sulfolobus sp. B5]TRM81942.1 hypothetical protein DJ524_02280 [Sulfolobus sp. D5]TRM82785.1 hypothetical protein DJ531_08420 [Sulfolobus sp. A20-N-F6]TRM85460.1 hypothetical protein DJ522_00525 [Sulfolobus sp. F3]TRM89522.1 hypothetical protein DJ529_01815
MDYKQLNDEYYNVLRSGEVPILSCKNCGYSFTNLRTTCPKCSSDKLNVRGAKEGVVYSYTIIERGLPFTAVLLLVDINGVRVKANYLGDPKKLRIGLKVRSKYVKQELIESIVFEPAE